MPDGLYVPMPGSPVTYLTEGINSSIATIPVDDLTKLPNPPNIATIGDGVGSETIKYTGKSATALTGVTRGFEGSAREWGQGVPIANVPCAQHFRALQANILRLIPDVGHGENGSWMRWDNGVQICWVSLDLEFDLDKLLRTTWVFPKPFINDNQAITFSTGLPPSKGGKRTDIFPKVTYVTNTECKVAIRNENGAFEFGDSVNARVSAVGWWKNV